MIDRTRFKYMYTIPRLKCSLVIVDMHMTAKIELSLKQKNTAVFYMGGPKMGGIHSSGPKYELNGLQRPN